MKLLVTMPFSHCSARMNTRKHDRQLGIVDDYLYYLVSRKRLGRTKILYVETVQRYISERWYD